MIYLVRHGQTDWNAKKIVQGTIDIPLNDVGREQARETALEVAKFKVEHIFSSDLSRAMETAEIIGRHIGVSVAVDKRLREMDSGDLQGKSKDELPGGNTWELVANDPKRFNAEPLEDAFVRVKEFLDEIESKKLENMLIVSHAGTCTMLMYCARNKVFNKREYFDSKVILGNAVVYKIGG